MPDLLFELFSEEIPARMQARAADDLKKMVTDKLVDAGLVYEGARAFATPRRLALTGMFAGLAWGAGYAESIPNFEFLTVIVFAGGWVVGPAWGAIAGALAAFLFSAINPYGSGLAVPLVLVAQMIGLALAGAVGGALARRAPSHRIARAIAIVLAGIAITLVYDLLTNGPIEVKTQSVMEVA